MIIIWRKKNVYRSPCWETDRIVTADRSPMRDLSDPYSSVGNLRRFCESFSILAPPSYSENNNRLLREIVRLRRTVSRVFNRSSACKLCSEEEGEDIRFERISWYPLIVEGSGSWNGRKASYIGVFIRGTRRRRRKSMILEEATNGEHEGEKASKVFINFRGGEMETTLFLKIRESKKFEVSWLKTPIVSKKRKKKKIQRNKNSIQFARYPGKLLRMEKLNWIKSFLKITGSEAKYSIDSTFGPRRSRERESNFNKN